METKIDAELSQRVREAKSAEPQPQIPVIVTLSDGADIGELERRGLKIVGRFENIPAVYGNIAAPDVSQVEELDFVARIEYDSRAWALDASQS